VHALNFLECAEIRVTRQIDDFCQNFGFFLCENGPRYSYQNFTTYTPRGSTYNTIEILTLTPNNFEKLGNLFWGWGPRAGRVGVFSKLKMVSAREPPRVQNKTISRPLAQRTSAQ